MDVSHIAVGCDDEHPMSPIPAAAFDSQQNALAFDGGVLLGGASRRYGRDKALAHHDGQAMGERMIDILLGSGAARVITVGGPDRGFPVPHVPDRYPGQGPLGGLISALGACQSDLLVVLACDLPNLTPATVVKLVATAVQNPGYGAVGAFTDRKEPLCACYRVSLASTPARASFDQGIRSLTTFLDTIKILWVVLPDPGELRNVNTPEDHLT